MTGAVSEGLLSTHYCHLVASLSHSQSTCFYKVNLGLVLLSRLKLCHFNLVGNKATEGYEGGGGVIVGGNAQPCSGLRFPITMDRSNDRAKKNETIDISYVRFPNMLVRSRLIYAL